MAVMLPEARLYFLQRQQLPLSTDGPRLNAGDVLEEHRATRLGGSAIVISQKQRTFQVSLALI